MKEKDWKQEVESLRALLEELRNELEKRYADIEAIYRIVRIIHYALDIEELSRTVKDVIENVLQMKTYSLMVLDREKREYVFQVAGNISQQTINKVVHEMDEIEPGWVQKPLAEKPPVTLSVREKEPLSFLCLPLHTQTSMIWTLCAPAETIKKLNKIDQDVISIITTQIAITIETTKLYSLTKELSITDEASGLYNYSHFQRRVTIETERAKRFQRPLCIVLVDVDGFKKYTDRFGEERRDKVMGDIGSIIKNHCRRVDTAARHEIDEFILMLPETDDNGGRVVAEKIRQAVANHLFLGEEKRDQKLTVSLGVASYPKHTTDPYQVIKKSKEALAEAKRMGKNRIFISQ